MKFLEQLARARFRPTSVMLQYTLLAQRVDDAIVLFVEGTDDQTFYLSMLRRWGLEFEKVFCLICGGKHNVLEVRKKISQQDLYQTTTMFFVDKDLDDLIPRADASRGNVFITEWYSIENYLTTGEVFHAVWREFFRLALEDPRKEIAERQFCAEHAKFVRSMRIIMAWTLKRKRQGDLVKFEDLDLDKCFRLDEDMRFGLRRGAYRRVRRVCGGTTDGREWRDVRLVVNELKTLHPKRYVRGKFELWFFVKFLARLDQELRKTTWGSVRPRNSFTISGTTAMEVLIPRCSVVSQLVEFFRRNLRG